jgi:alanine racemase
VLVDGERCPVVGAVSMDATAIRLGRRLPPGTTVTLVGPDLPLEEHARVADTLTYELACRIDSSPTRASRTVHGYD